MKGDLKKRGAREDGFLVMGKCLKSKSAISCPLYKPQPITKPGTALAFKCIGLLHKYSMAGCGEMRGEISHYLRKCFYSSCA